ncbi:hypothetical protein Micbo1qcDRAFT_205091 [Microdochium bolleyi]|uniref:Aminotransferase n=1 Tax=Microdochium bolleyi TaxID=196109 RepID=A0A136J1J4_9PEZI|nr:hypothetical protein Micbo1qcDRAFT_205091 [Microdochium bolleyi]
MPVNMDWTITTSLRHDPALLQVPDHPAIPSSHAGTTDSCFNQRTRSPFLMLDYHQDRLLQAARYFGWPQAVGKLSGEAGLQFLTSSIPGDIAHQLKEDHHHHHSPGAARKLRICVSQDGSVTHDISDTPGRPLESLFPTALPGPEGDLDADSIGTGPAVLAPRVPPTPFTVVVDSQPTRASAFTHFKTTNRAAYDDARRRMTSALAGSGSGSGSGISPSAAEILLVGQHDRCIMEGSFTTPYFWRSGRWVTPPVTRLPTAQPARPAPAGRQDTSDVHWSGGHEGVSRRWALERGLAIEQDVPAASLVDGEECWLSNGVRGFFVGKIKLDLPRQGP